MRTSKNRPRRRFGRRGYVLIVVLGIAVVTMSTGLAYMEAHSSIMPEAQNRVAGSRAKYLAESGVELAAYYLGYPPDSVTPGDYWRGGSGLRIDGSSDFVEVTVQEETGTPGVFRVNATGAAHDIDGSVRGKVAVSARILSPRDQKWRIPYGLLGNDLTVPLIATINGKTHANGRVNNLGALLDTVSATGLISWLVALVAPNLVDNAEPYVAPLPTVATYTNYVIADKSYAATVYNPSNMNQANAYVLNSTDMSATNIGRIIRVRSGDLQVEPPMTINGTLVVDGNLRIKTNGLLAIQAEPNFPALVVNGEIRFESNSAALLTYGSVIANGLDFDNRLQPSAEINGALVVTRDNFLENVFLILPKLHVDWDRDRATFWNLERTKNPDPVTILDWSEN